LTNISPFLDGRQCTHCGFGVLRAYTATHASWHGNHFVLVPNLPAWKCFYCGYVEHDSPTLRRVATVLGSSAEFAQQRLRWSRRQRVLSAQRRPKASSGVS